jgi:6,7-dimethyl-8-ribityllumazine synthase
MASKGNKKLLQSSTGTLSAKGACIVIVRTDWNPVIVDELEKGCRKVLKKKGVDTVETLHVPGAVEIPFAIRTYWDRMKYRDDRPMAFIALACIIRGDTPHFDYVCRAVTDGIVQLNLNIPVPTIFGVLTVNTEQQARERIGGKHGHKGEEAALTAIQMTELVKNIKNR